MTRELRAPKIEHEIAGIPPGSGRSLAGGPRSRDQHDGGSYLSMDSPGRGLATARSAGAPLAPILRLGKTR